VEAAGVILPHAIIDELSIAFRPDDSREDGFEGEFQNGHHSSFEYHLFGRGGKFASASFEAENETHRLPNFPLFLIRIFLLD
jgi:hypothetical protein